MCHQCGVSSHIRPKCHPPKPPRHHRSPPINHGPRHQQLQKPTQAKKTWVPKKLYIKEQKNARREISYEFLHTRSGQISSTTAKEGRTGQERGHPPPRGSRPTQ
jgi:hypothetical protein